MKPAVRWLLSALALACLAPVAHPQITAAPSQMNLQGRLTRSDGTSVPDGNYSVRFSLWDAPTGGAEKWNQTINPLATHAGLFSALVSGFPAGLFNGTLWLEIQVGTDPAMTPRQPLATVPYAFKANSVADGAVGTAALADAAVTAAKIAPGALGSGQFALSPGLGIVGETASASYPVRIAVEGSHAYPLENNFYNSILHVVDISNRNAPYETGTIATSKGPIDVATLNNTAYVVGNNARLEVFDVSNPSAPVQRSHVSGDAWTVAVDGTYVYTADTSNSNSTLEVFDVSNPAAPSLVGQTSLGIGFPTIVLHGDTAYVAMEGDLFGGTSSVKVIDISNPSKPVAGVTLPLPAFVRDMVASNGYLYVGVGNNSAANSSLITFDISNPASPVQMGAFGTAGIPTSIAIAGNTLTVSDDNPSFTQVFDVSNGASPRQIDWGVMPEYSGGQVSAVPGYILQGGPDFRILSTQAPRSPASLQATGSVVVDGLDVNDGDTTNALVFGTGSGEAIASKRTATGNQYGLDFYTGFTPKMHIQNNGNVGIGMTPSYTLDVNGTIRGTNVTPSDARFKQHISPIPGALSKVLHLRGVEFDWKPDGVDGRRFPEGRQVGFVAQEVEKVLPEIVSTDDHGYKSVAYQNVVPALVEALKDQQKRIDHLEAEVRALRQRKGK